MRPSVQAMAADKQSSNLQTSSSIASARGTAPSSGQPSADAVPEWMSCDLTMYRVLQDTSAQIASNCKSFSQQLEGVCGVAKSQLPQDDSFNTFLTTFVSLSTALLQLSTDLETSMTHPLQSVIATLQEETLGRRKHWCQLRSRLAELQDRYCRSHEAANKAKGRLAVAAEDQKGWFKKKTDDKAAIEQHAAMCDLAKCEEELRESEACLKQLEKESREHLRQLDNEKRAILRGALTKGASTVRRCLMVVADKAPSDSQDSQQADHSEWRGIVPQEDSAMCGSADAPGLSCSATDSVEDASSPSGSAAAPELTFTPEALRRSPCQQAQDASSAAATAPAATANASLSAQPADDQVEYNLFSSPGCSSSTTNNALEVAAKYTPGRGLLETRQEIGLDVSDEEPEEDASSRASNWTPSRSPAVRTPARRTLVFQSASNGLALRRPSDLTAANREGPKSAEGRWAADVLRSVGDGSPEAVLGSGGADAPATQPSPQDMQRPRRTAEIEEDDDDDMEDSKAPSPAVPQLLDKAEVEISITPMAIEHPQKCFERYVQRLPSRLAFANETAWSKLQARATEQIVGGHLGKLEFFWIHRSGVNVAPETVDGLVCFQFVQGFAANFVRILHLSTIGALKEKEVNQSQALGSPKEPNESDWPSLMPSAIFEVRRLIFATLPVDSIRAIVFAGEDETGRIYVDRDVEVSYQRCRFRWFQLTQSLRRTRSVIGRKEKLKPSARFLVLHAARGEQDPPAPRSSISTLPALKLRDDPDLAALQGNLEGGATAAPSSAPTGFSAF